MTAGGRRTALVTGANSGLGLETAGQLAEHGFARVIITARSDEKAELAKAELEQRTGTAVFETLTLDNGEPDTVEAAAATLADRGGSVDVLILNAGIAPTKELLRTEDGIEMTVAASITGHHLLTMRLLEEGLLSESARIIIAGSEAARGDVPTFKSVDIHEMAGKLGGDLEAAIEAQMRMEKPAEYKPSDTYATAKVFVAWWAAELARKLPEGMSVNAVSPGSTPDTNAARNAPTFMRRVMLPIFKFVPGMSHSVADGAGRYLEVAGYGPERSGEFFASKPKKMTGPLHEIGGPPFDDTSGQAALWSVVSRVTRGAGYPAVGGSSTG